VRGHQHGHRCRSPSQLFGRSNLAPASGPDWTCVSSIISTDGGNRARPRRRPGPACPPDQQPRLVSAECRTAPTTVSAVSWSQPCCTARPNRSMSVAVNRRYKRLLCATGPPGRAVVVDPVDVTFPSLASAPPASTLTASSLARPFAATNAVHPSGRQAEPACRKRRLARRIANRRTALA